MQFVKGPYILFASQYDSWQLPFDLSTSPNQTFPPPYVGNKLFYAELFGELSQSLMRGLPSKIDFEALEGQVCNTSSSRNSSIDEIAALVW